MSGPAGTAALSDPARVFAIGDLHLSFTANKPMDVFGALWDDHVTRLGAAWRETVAEGDLVLVPGDISWAMHLSDAREDLDFLGALPGQKLILRGNHDYWWSSLSQVRAALPPSVRAIQNDSARFGPYAVGGTRGWSHPSPQSSADDARIYARELGRLELSLRSMPEDAIKIAMLHFPPFDETHGDSAVTALLEKYGVSHAVYAHLHGRAHRASFTGEKNGVQYVFAAADYLAFRPIRIM